MGSTTAALPKKLQNAITERMRLSLLRGDTPFDKARLADAAFEKAVAVFSEADVVNHTFRVYQELLPEEPVIA